MRQAVMMLRRGLLGQQHALPACCGLRSNKSSGVIALSSRCVSVDSYIKEGRAIARALQYMKDLQPRVVVVMEKVQLVGCRNVLPLTAERVISQATVRIRCLTHADCLSDDALRHQIAVAEEQEQRRYYNSYKPSNFIPTAIIALNLQAVQKTKSLRPVQDAIFGAAEIAQHNQILVCGLPNVGKSSIILPLTKQRTMTVRNKKAYHLPKVSDRAGMTIAVKKHVMESIQSGHEVSLIDTPGLRPRLETGMDVRQAALYFAAHVTEPFPGYHEFAPIPIILTTLLQAANRHAVLSRNESEQKVVVPPYVELLGLNGPTEDPNVLIEAYLAKEGKSSTASNFKEKPLLRKFHSGEYGGLVFTPLYHKYLQEQQATAQSSLSSSTSQQLRLHRQTGSPIVYMNESAMRLIDVAHGRGQYHFPSSRVNDDDRNNKSRNGDSSDIVAH